MNILIPRFAKGTGPQHGERIADQFHPFRSAAAPGTADPVLAAWMVIARRNPARRLCRGLERDSKAVVAAIATSWSTSPAEGRVTRLQAINCSMYVRAGFHLLRQRVLLAA